ncbi:MAG: hypothetical protein A2509_03710 [Candidatus Edwardsbacteria bacterium RIFOXYD12_FULL_50_11]|uniref:Uncharacterized protein n=1 Tax=Candidatus Edwardsbacteria bacterium GWF2_54_11 TaxID=1817851 RepID=A0A1F5R7R8_9BACT|nr:MAG: hypothetical protein A2502_03620 [Candidatus Edwardsbacteria bacterium RifOxyC12_full_54_24]OGF07802.1 MAG: hypothetical protein A2273_04870 [Candidatus Edwardsbacteria bacterium RifOxyA12_full_54_48]OGF10051.1 MAG: hypothetical protein A3K15_11285 [Candidatus Edwardsbacteria bacterium GWE2_54_12]OGF10482.1 MAG: hypothetical protein A2024_09030 [Candidatus Edwardsbacteria bacterium GWF2_54_11]OGF14963.1 MAG: hypothetical protein A2509_03710 [Candidatus Edwardsbacteria bacterium RIFOXYD1
MVKIKSSTQALKIGAMFILAVTLISCGSMKVRMVGQYDQMIDRQVTELQESTMGFFNKMERGLGTDAAKYESNKQFYYDAKVIAQCARTRAEAHEYGLKFKPLSDNLKSLEEQYVDLETLHKMNFNEQVLESSRKAFEQSFTAVIRYLLALNGEKEQTNKEGE